MNDIDRWRQEPLARAAAESFGDGAAVVETAIAIQQIAAPTFDEGRRAAYAAEQMRSIGLADVEIDAVGNVYGRRPGAVAGQPGLLIAAHLDTVFPAGTDLTVRRVGSRVYGPGIGDNSMGVAALLNLARALQHNNVAHAGEIWFVANVGEEGLGDLRGMRAAVDRLAARIGAAIALEGCDPDRIIHAGLAVRRYRIEAAAGGGHSWGDFGAPSAIHALVRLAARLSRLDAPSAPRSSFNIGVIEGGNSVNSIAERAALLLDLRSTETSGLQALIRQVEAAVAEARAGESGVTFTLATVGDRPGGAIAREHPLARAAGDAYRAEGFQSSYTIASTDANIPLSRGIPAVCVGVCDGANEHRLDEYVEPARLAAGMRGLLWLVLAASGGL